MNTDKLSAHTPSPATRRWRHQRGASDLDTIWMIVIIVVLLTIAYLILGWFRSSKDEKVQRRYDEAVEAVRRKRAPLQRDNRAPSGHQMVF